MKLKNLIIFILSISAAGAAFAEKITAESYAFPFILKIDSKDAVSNNFITLPRAKFENPNANREIKAALLAVLTQSENFDKHLLNPKDSAKAKAFLKKLGDPAKVQITHCVFWNPNNDMLAFFQSPESKLRPDMNYFAFKYDGGVWKWDVGAKNNLISILSESVRTRPPHRDDKEPFYSDIEFTDISNGKNAELPVLKFYKDAQAEFYKLNLPAYAEIMTDKSKEVYTAQYLSMTLDEQKEALKDYITYHKQFKFIAKFKDVEAGGERCNLYVILFTREKDGKINSYDAAYIVETHNGKFMLANFGQNQGFVADLLISMAKKHSYLFGQE